MTTDKLTVCIPVYNGAKYLAESIASVLSQSYSDFRLIISDDCSVDNSAEVIRSFRDPRISYIRNPRRLGLVGNWNKCVSLCNGDYVYLWHQDDVMMRENLRKKVDVLDAHPAVGFVHSNIIFLDEIAHETRGHWAEDSTWDYVVPGYFFFLRALNEGAVVCPTAMIRNECYARLGAYRQALPFACDYEFFMRLSLYYDVACIGEPLVRNRWHHGSETQNFFREGTVLDQLALARNLVLAEHGHRIPDLRLAADITAHAAAWDAMDFAYRYLSQSQTSSREFHHARRYFCRAISRRPGLLARRRSLWVLERLLFGSVGLRMARKVKHMLKGQSLEAPPSRAGLPKQGINP